MNLVTEMCEVALWYLRDIILRIYVTESQCFVVFACFSKCRDTKTAIMCYATIK